MLPFPPVTNGVIEMLQDRFISYSKAALAVFDRCRETLPLKSLSPFHAVRCYGPTSQYCSDSSWKQNGELHKSKQV